ncbi:DNA-binding transcriptional MerR regulator [Streptosporangium becharense]|uniref:DNA-binding transcriptional MerR regulator n=1 Tax=Streptosporangium becharense TaxID=1816182 RepID=A0A7W9IJF6_9ACTN|nr:MerR family transcriptional regulator [Streptosporangium becharense]MBB2911120.1 DNA-binding transcriptional MerR regulator [Streptosporangium becharense]MBB5821822.1 DNA-binding transcriptional MerR regulator [Streptosporangium becharense]
MGMTIQEAARKSGLSAHTLRYYERIGLIHEVGRNAGGHRSYTAPDLEWLRFLTRLRATGMPIADMCRYAELRRRGPATLAERRRMLQAHRARVEARITQLTGDLTVLDEKIDFYITRENQ